MGSVGMKGVSSPMSWRKTRAGPRLGVDTQISVFKSTLWGPGSDNAPKLSPPPQKTTPGPLVLEPHSNISGPAIFRKVGLGLPLTLGRPLNAELPSPYQHTYYGYVLPGRK